MATACGDEGRVFQFLMRAVSRQGFRTLLKGIRVDISLVAEWIHFALFGVILPTIEGRVYTFGGL